MPPLLQLEHPAGIVLARRFGLSTLFSSLLDPNSPVMISYGPLSPWRNILQIAHSISPWRHGMALGTIGWML